MTTQTNNPGGPNGPLTELPKGPKRPYQDVIILLLVVASGTLLFLALPSLIGAEGLFDWAKCAVLALAATAVAYGVNRLALDYGARQAAIGTTGAAALSVGSILLIGLATFFATFAGFTIDGTNTGYLQGYVTNHSAYLDGQLRTLQQVSDPTPVLQAIASDMAAKAACEVTEACVTGRGAQEGPVSRLFASEAARAAAILEQVRGVSGDRTSVLAQLGSLQEALQQATSDAGLSPSDQRVQVQSLTGQIDQALAGLTGNSAETLIRGYANELDGAAAAAPHASAARILSGYAVSLRDALGDTSAISTLPRPQLPAEAGVIDTLSQIGRYLPIAMIVAAVELIFPLALWLYRTFALRADVIRNRESARNQPIETDETRSNSDGAGAPQDPKDQE